MLESGKLHGSRRFLERISEFRQQQEKRAAKREAEAIEAELEKADQLDQSVVLAPGTKRQSRLVAEEQSKGSVRVARASADRGGQEDEPALLTLHRNGMNFSPRAHQMMSRITKLAELLMMTIA